MIREEEEDEEASELFGESDAAVADAPIGWSEVWVGAVEREKELQCCCGGEGSNGGSSFDDSSLIFCGTKKCDVIKVFSLVMRILFAVFLCLIFSSSSSAPKTSSQ